MTVLHLSDASSASDRLVAVTGMGRRWCPEADMTLWPHIVSMQHPIPRPIRKSEMSSSRCIFAKIHVFANFVVS